MRNRLSRPLALATATTALALAGVARAQVDIDPPLPNVLLLVDTSGSMERMADGTTVESNGMSACNPGAATNMNRWATLVSVLTGTIPSFSCQTLPRDAAFADTYGVNTVPSYDKGYYLPHHRILSDGCAVLPGAPQPTYWWEWATNPFAYKKYSDASTCTFTQLDDGLIDTFSGRMRFGLMTFDTLPNSGTGISGTGINATSGEAGMWSYFPGWASGTASPASGSLLNCPTRTTYEVGARNGAAPPWEGPLLPFGPYAQKVEKVKVANERVQQAIRAMRPYGATPLAGMLQDAQYYLYTDDTTYVDHSDPTTPVTTAFSPKDDPYVSGGCRTQYIIVLSDGEPNMDMRPECEKNTADPSACPYRKAADIARDMATYSNPNRRVQTFVVGFGLSTAGGYDCSTLTATQLTDGTCTSATGALKACCSLTEIAYNGGTTNAYFANDITGLRTALSTVFNNISKGSTARTYPVFSTAAIVAGAGSSSAVGFQFLSSFNALGGSAVWSGNLERERYTCATVSGVLQAQLQDVDASKGDDFGANLNKTDDLHPRQIFTSLPAESGVTSDVYTERSVRPNVGVDDGLGLTTQLSSPANGLQTAPNFITSMKSVTKAVGIDPATAPTLCTTTLRTASSGTCVERLFNWELGISNTPYLDDTRDPAKCPPGQQCSMLGSIYHATPAIVGPPKDFLRDESYAAFAVGAAGKRPAVLYAATTDGQLHAFKVAANDTADAFKVDSNVNNELWSFYPPHALKGLLTTYNQQAMLLDGSPVVKDIIFERTRSQALAGGGTGSADWHSVLVAGGGAAGGFYYALDVTNPAAPTFLWQLSTDASGSPLFGDTVPQPAIATVTLTDGLTVKEVAVAILAGGTAPLLPGACARQQVAWPNLKLEAFKVRPQVRCWGTANASPNPPTEGAARSVTIVRLDTGEVLQNLRGALVDGPAGFATTVSKVVSIDSPMSGIPVAYPSQVGDVADRAYIGDSDGTLWRIDLSSSNPANWTIEMAWDAYSLVDQAGDTQATSEPIQTPPIVSIDALGNPVVLFSTGDQELFTVPSATTRAWSLTETPRSTGTGYTLAYNWVIPFPQGERITGPISLFNGVAYFATFTPQTGTSAACDDGYGSIWGVDYVLGTGASPGKYPNPMFVPDPVNAPSTRVASQQQPAGSVVFGVGVTQTPSCADTESYADPYLGQHTAVSQASGGTYQLVYETGKGGTAQNGSKTNTASQALPTPRQTTRISSWASIVE